MKNKKVSKPRQQGKKNPLPKANKVRSEKRKYLLFLGIIVVISCIVYLPALQNGFQNAWDDDHYIRNNPLIYSFNLKEIFSQYVMGNYHPLTILTLATEFHLFGLNETGFHAVNLFFHMLNVVLVFYAVFMLSDKVEVALLASLLFGIHPMHVESVAWAAALKDLEYTCFMLAAYICYLKYQNSAQKKFYFFALLLFIASLLSKAMAVSLPVILVLTDYFMGRKINRKSLLEKVPFFILALIFGFVAFAAQKSASVIQDVTVFSLPQRIVFACYGYITYLAKLVVPLNLSAFYPYPVQNGLEIPVRYYAYIIFVLALVAFVIYTLRYSKKIAFGIGFFTVSIFLVLQLWSVGGAVMADRYSYVSSIGIFYLAAEGIYFLWDKKRKWMAILIIGVSTIFYSVTTFTRCRVWKNDLSLWDDVISKFQTISLAYYNRGLAFMNENKITEALEDYTKAIELKSTYTEAYVNRGNILRDSQKHAEALEDYNTAISLKPGFSIAYFNRGVLYMNDKRTVEALNDFAKAIELNPRYFKAYNNRGNLYYAERRYAEAIHDFSAAIELKPDYFEAIYNRGLANYYSGNTRAGCEDFKLSAGYGFKPASDQLLQVCK